MENNGRTLKTESCSGNCGKVLTQWVVSGGACKCGDCKDSESRKVSGWTAQNSKD